MVAAARRTAEILWDIGAVNFNAKNPFTLTSGAQSPVYIDCRKIISFLSERRAITGMAADMLGNIPADYIAGGETAGISYAAWISDALSKPMLYVRKKPKGFGKGSQIEGAFFEGARVLLVEDLTTDGGSKIAFVNALREAGAVVTDVFSVFYYGIFPQDVFVNAGLKLHYLSTWKDVLGVARDRALFSGDDLTEVERFLASPATWGQSRAAAG